MRIVSLSWLASLLLCLSAPLSAADLKIVTVDEGRVLEESALVANGYENLKNQVVDAEEGLKGLATDLKRIETKRKAVPENSPRSFELLEQLEAGKVQLKMRREHLQKRLHDMELQLVKDVTNKVRAALATYAEEKGIDLILRNDTRELQSRELKELMTVELPDRTLLYANPTLDITDDFITYLNNLHPAEAGNDKMPPAGGLSLEPGVELDVSDTATDSE